MTTQPSQSSAGLTAEWSPDFTELATTTPWTAADWRDCWDLLPRAFRDEYHWPAVTGMAVVFGFSPARCAIVLDGYAAALTAAEPAPVSGARWGAMAEAQMDRPAYELVRLIQDLLDDCDQFIDTPEQPNNVRVWAVRAVMEDFGGRPHRWTPPRCEDCNHPFSMHDDDCWLCECALTRGEALNGRDDAIDEAIEQAMREAPAPTTADPS